MSRKIVAGNWKMNKSIAETHALVQELNEMASAWPSDVKVIISPPMLYLTQVAVNVEDNLHVAAQNCHAEKSGAYTGEVSAAQLKSSEINFCILGHSERRQYFGETDASVNAKVKSCLAEGVTPIVCIGELLEERETGKEFTIVEAQLRGGLKGLSSAEIEKCIVAYEPVWAIGTGKTASSDQAQEIHAFIRTKLAELSSQEAADKISILYGGSCKPANSKEIFSKPDVDGGLIGGASLNASDFNALINSY